MSEEILVNSKVVEALKPVIQEVLRDAADFMPDDLPVGESSAWLRKLADNWGEGGAA